MSKQNNRKELTDCFAVLSLMHVINYMIQTIECNNNQIVFVSVYYLPSLIEMARFCGD